MIEPEEWEPLVLEIARLNNLTRAEAEKILVKVGDSPVIDEDGLVIVGKKRLIWPQ